MHRGIEKTEEGAVTTREEFHTPPSGGWHDSVMDNVQSRDLIVFLTQHKENSVEKLGEFAEIVPPAALGDDVFIGIIRWVVWLAENVVSAHEPRMS